MDEATHRKWTTLLQAVSTIALIVGGIFALWRYYDTTARQFQKPLWDEQVKLYFQATRVAADLSTLERGEHWNTAADHFWALYRGPMCIVEDQAVEEAMVKFGRSLYDTQTLEGILESIKAKGSKSDPTEDLLKQIKDSKKKLQSEALNLAWACRDSLNLNLDAGLPALKHRKQQEEAEN